MNGILTTESWHRNVVSTVIQTDDPSVAKEEKMIFYVFQKWYAPDNGILYKFAIKD